MTPVFADTFYYLALLNADDEAHAKAAALSASLAVPVVTTAWVLTELADAYSESAFRGAFLRLLQSIRADSRCTMVPASQPLFEKGLELFSKRPDKDWSLTDCVSFMVMEEHEIMEALTGDHHFTQAGFRILFR